MERNEKQKPLTKQCWRSPERTGRVSKGPRHLPDSLPPAIDGILLLPPAGAAAQRVKAELLLLPPHVVQPHVLGGCSHLPWGCQQCGAPEMLSLACTVTVLHAGKQPLHRSSLLDQYFSCMQNRSSNALAYSTATPPFPPCLLWKIISKLGTVQ